MSRFAILLLAAASCSAPPADGALLALVEFGAGSTSRCVQVVVRTPDGAETRSKPVVTDRSRAVKVGIARAGLPVEVVIYAVGYADEACKTPTMERTEDGSGIFKTSRVSTVALTLIPRPNAKDGDGDGYASTASGGDDCDDVDPSIHPGAAEVCGDGKDNDCDRKADCAETMCLDKACGSGAGAICRNALCTEQLCNDDQDNDGDGAADCADLDCSFAACRNGGTCQDKSCKGASSEKDLCGDGADNDGDQAADCADSDCLGALCNAMNACLVGPRCDAAKSCSGGTPVSCSSPGSACLQAIGTCNPADGGCTYGPAPGKACSDSNACTAADTCTDAGACLGSTSLACLAPSGCAVSTGCTADAGCMFGPSVGAACDDGNPCTVGDACLPDAGCGGGAVSCAPSACQLPSTQCTADGGCLFGPRDAGSACDGGKCNGAGTCIPLFPSPPSNFTESLLPTPAGPTTLDCTVTLDSRTDDGGVDFNGWCGNPNPPFKIIAQPNGFDDALLLSFSELDVGINGSVRMQGDRPVIFASTGSMRILGELRAQAGTRSCADGGSGGAPSSDKGGGGAGFGAVGGSGGKSGGAGGLVNGEPLLVPLRGGCPGGGGGRGGGALQLSAAGNLTITGTIAAPGRGGGGGLAANNGGIGAGSGGGLLLEGLFVLVGPTGAVTANGGGGGEGAGLILNGGGGATGELRLETPAAGGSGNTFGGPGGAGAAGMTAATGGAGSTFNGGGGGGAGVGRVRINAVTCNVGVGAVMSPKPTVNLDAGCPP